MGIHWECKLSLHGQLSFTCEYEYADTKRPLSKERPVGDKVVSVAV